MKRRRAKLLEIYSEAVLKDLEFVINEIRGNLFFKPKEVKETAHYTSLHTLKSLADNGPFRLYNAAYMNDPEEGRTFFKIMHEQGIDDVEELFYKSGAGSSQTSPAYVGSFVPVNTERERKKGNLSLWRFYGRHDNKEAAGACLVFNVEQFAPIVSQMSTEPTSARERHGHGKEQGSKPEIFRVSYKGEVGLSKSLEALVPPLKEIQKFCKENEDENEKENERDTLVNLVRDLLDSIRFFFKSEDYSDEHEVRIIQMSYQDEEGKQPGRKVDVERIPPRFYVEMPRNFTFGRVILGPTAGDVSDWRQWLEAKGIVNVEPSTIPFGKRS